ncbi:hypothetical protein QAD02_016690 [Eretmocerus hayati]|uniref:Uncharacterized protein n=1 Tax=Eretmocerus hayati TaxID=131215 RepID=A0ACC2PBT2_9HYME|nr:hypothetical protein QAD02_016690 [Eretmocerus hayati]
MTLLTKLARHSLNFAFRSVSRSVVCCSREENRLLGRLVSASNNNNHLCLLSTVPNLNCGAHQGNKDGSRGCETPLFVAASLAFLGFFEKEEEKEPELITTIKRSILLIQKGEFKKAEQMLHIALRLAQTLQDEQGVTYVYDVMANLAFEVGDYVKAQKLFQSVMQRILAAGTPQDDPKIVHMSLKMAKILESKGDYLNAESGYKYCLDILQKHIDAATEDLDIIALWGMNLDWYSHMLLAINRYSEAMKLLEKAYDVCVQLNGELHEQSIILLNDLGSVSFLKGNLDDAEVYLRKATEIGDKLSDMEDLASIHINLGNVLMKKGLLDEAKRSCSRGWIMAKSKKDPESQSEAKNCLDEVVNMMSK